MSSPSAIPGGLVPGFPATLPPQLENAWLTLAHRPQHVSISAPADGSVRIVLKRNPRAMWTLIAVATLGSGAILLAAWLFDRYQDQHPRRQRQAPSARSEVRNRRAKTLTLPRSSETSRRYKPYSQPRNCR
jgi:hypothetical protein